MEVGRFVVAIKNLLIGWLDLGDEDQARARDYLAGFKTEGTVDELGFGIMRDALADEFFPATNTIMTRTRYLVFVPALYLMIERERVSGAQAAARMKQLEDQLRVALDRPEIEGVIGRRAKENLARYPSNVYWSAIKQLGIFLRPRWSQSYYHDHLKQHYADSSAFKDDDGLSHLAAGPVRNWDAGLLDVVHKSKTFPSDDLELSTELSFDLTGREARYLRDRFEMIGTNQPSLLLHLIRLGNASTFDYPWEVPCPDGLRRAVTHARCLSVFAKGATLVYYQLLIEAREAAGITPPVYDLLGPFTVWWTIARDELRGWDLGDFFQLMHGLSAVRPRDREFFDEFHANVLRSGSASDLLHGEAGRRLVRTREKTKRPRKARLAGGDHLRQWDPPESLEQAGLTNPAHIPYWLNYRSGIGGIFVREIVRGLGSRSSNV
jgi:hypothetical protein